MNHLYSLLGARQAGGAEGVHETDFAEPVAYDVLHRFDKALRLARGTMPLGADIKAAEDKVAAQVEQALKALRQDKAKVLPVNQRLGLETVVRADGTRPSLLVTGDGVNPDHPMAACWREQLAATREAVSLLAGATARVQPHGGSRTRFFGTAFLVCAAPARLVTNRHVAMQALRRAVATREAAPHPLLSSYRVHAGTIEAEFDGSQDSKINKVVAIERVILPPWPNTACQPSMDIAVLELSPFSINKIAEPITLHPSSDFELEGTIHSFCIIGFPGSPARRIGVVDGIDWAYVDRVIFNESYGVKRLAPGVVTRSLERLDQHGAGYTFCHDATTLGGSSGSAICAWKDGKKIFGLHFSGVGSESNRAHGFSSPDTAELMRAMRLFPSA